MAAGPDSASALLHATAIAIDGRAALLFGPPGTGKSDLAFRCLTQPVLLQGRSRVAMLVADDQVQVASEDGVLVCRPPPAIAGKLEVRGLGIVEVSHVPSACVALAVVLDHGPIERLPMPAVRCILGLKVPEIRLAPFEASAPLKLMLALLRAGP